MAGIREPRGAPSVGIVFEEAGGKSNFSLKLDRPGHQDMIVAGAPFIAATGWRLTR